MADFIEVILQDNKKATFSKSKIIMVEPLDNGKTRITIEFKTENVGFRYFFTNESYEDLVAKLNSN